MRFILILCLASVLSISAAIQQHLKKKKPSSERIMVDHGLELYQNLQKSESDCFKRATMRLANGCEGLQFGTQENMDYAIMLTLCELETAQIAIPNECKPLLKDTKDRNRHVENCIKKIAKNPQTWTTYSGYFRDVAIMCHALHHPIHKDLLEKLHINITLNQVKNFEILQNQQQMIIKWKEEELKRLEQLKSSQSQVLDQIKNVQAFHARSAIQIEQIFQSLVFIHEQTEIIVSDHNQVIESHVENMQSKFDQLANLQEDELERVMDVIKNRLKLIDKSVEGMVHTQQDMLARWASTHDDQIKILKSWKGSLDESSMNLQQSLKSSIEKVNLLKQDVFIIHTQVKGILAPIQWTNNAIDTFKKTAMDIIVFWSFFLIMIAALKSYNPYASFFLSFAAAVAHQHAYNQFCLMNPTCYNSIGYKILIIFAEWLLKSILEAVFELIQILRKKSRSSPAAAAAGGGNLSTSSSSSSSSSSESSSSSTSNNSGPNDFASTNSRSSASSNSSSSTDYGDILRGPRYPNGNASRAVRTYLRNNPSNR